MNNYFKLLLIAFFFSTIADSTQAAADIHRYQRRKSIRTKLSPQKKSQLHILKKCATYICTQCIEYLNIKERFDVGIKKICKENVLFIEQAYDETFFAKILVPELNILMIRELEKLKIEERNRVWNIQHIRRSPSPEFEEAQEQWQMFAEQIEDEQDPMIRGFFLEHQKKQENIMQTQKNYSDLQWARAAKKKIRQHTNRIKELNVLIKTIEAGIKPQRSFKPYISSPLRLG